MGANGLKLLQSFEKLEKNIYDTDGGGHCTIGWGHLVHKGKCDGRENEKAFSKGITASQSNNLLNKDVHHAVKAVEKSVNVPLTQNQRDALTSFAYNTGSGSLHKVIRHSKDKQGNIDVSKLPALMKQYNKSSGKILNGLVRRRQAEVDLFNKK